MGFKSEADFLDRLRSLVDIREIISEYVPLKKSGARYRGLCPFHAEKTPSFYVDAGKQLFYCFGCATGGDAFKFLMLYEKIEFPDALKLLAGRYGVPVPERTGGSPERDRALRANRAALEYFRSSLAGPEGAAGKKYLGQRKIQSETAEAFEIGFAPDRWDGIKSRLGVAGFTEDQLVFAGLLLRKEETGRTYDRFRNRLIFPIHNLNGECVGFGGRILGEGEPKYLNSPETVLFRKGEILFGLHRTADAIRKAGEAVLVEGYLDLLTLHQAGFRNLAAPLGTGFTAAHARLLGRFARRVVVNFDPDSAGEAATRRSLDILLESGFDVRVLRLPGGKDPDRFVREEGAGAYRSLLEGAVPCIAYLAREAASRVDLESASGKIAALNQVLPYVARLESPIERSEQVKLLSEEFRIDDGLVLQELKSAVASRKPVLKSAPLPPELLSSPAARLIRILIEDAEARQSLIPKVRETDLKGSGLEGIWEAIRESARSGDEMTYPGIGSRLPMPADQELLVRIASPPAPAASLPEGEGCLKRLREGELARRLQELQERLEKAEPGTTVDDLLRQKMDVRREIQALRSAPAR